MISEKRCSKCGEYKSLTEFWKRERARDGHRGICIVCEKIDNKQYNETHKDLRRAVAKHWKDKNRAYCLEYDRNYKAIHKEQSALSQHEYYIKNREILLKNAKVYNKEHRLEKSLYNAEYYQKNKSDLKEYRKEYKSSPHGKLVYRVNENKRRALKLRVEGTHTIQDVLDQGEKQSWLCYWQGPYCTGYCKDNFHEDHYIPISRGGSNWPDNIVISCPNCNSQKHDKLPEEYLEFIEKLK